MLAGLFVLIVTRIAFFGRPKRNDGRVASRRYVEQMLQGRFDLRRATGRRLVVPKRLVERRDRFRKTFPSARHVRTIVERFLSARGQKSGTTARHEQQPD